MWGVCRKWGIPYPCRKIVTKYCATGYHMWRVLGAVARENYFCRDGNESHWWDKAVFFGFPTWHLVENVRVCRGSVPSEIRGCPNIVGEFPEFPPDVPDVPVDPGPS
ncbi:hypothetical protein BJ981_007535 [Sphaerisporangium krabiense]|uniref:Uncharacterized protein n=1 Tax=Sphaerisporangium krabiense TaxID=763782 RepID=A0A7W9DV54_9ACTN|nr:hypothetical protein [Sphaerisporangium krabiense]